MSDGGGNARRLLSAAPTTLMLRNPKDYPEQISHPGEPPCTVTAHSASKFMPA